MPFAKIEMGKEEIFETTVKDIDGKLLDRWVVLRRDFVKVLRILNKKYGLGMIVKEKKRDEDLDWALKEM